VTSAVAHAEHVSGAGEQGASGPWVQVDGELDRPEQVRSKLDLVDHPQAVVLEERRRVVPGGLEDGWVVEQAGHSIRLVGCDEPGQGALAGLACAVEPHHSGVGQRVANDVPGASRDHILVLRGRSISPRTARVVIWTHDSWSSGRMIYGPWPHDSWSAGRRPGP
jgi:hypothetical protein